MSSIFGNSIENVPYESYTIYDAYVKDEFPDKVMISVGAYRTDEGKPWVLPVVKKIKKMMAEDPNSNHEYLPMSGLPEFTQAATRMLFGANSKQIINGSAFGIQCLSGTGALKVGLLLLKRRLNRKVVYYSDPSWDNHLHLGVDTGFEHVRTYRYWDRNNNRMDFEGMCEDLWNAPENAIIVLHASAQNPSGVDPTEEQWIELSAIMKRKKLFPFFDIAYQGLASGDVEKDAWSVRYFANEGHELFCAQSFSKIFGLYGERIGNLAVNVNAKEKIPAIISQFELIIRGMYLSPPQFGAVIVATTLNNPEYFEEWLQCVRTMHERMTLMKRELRKRLEARTRAGAWKHLTDQVGMFCYTRLPVEAVEILRYKYHIYMIKNGRISVSGLNTKNLDYVADAIVKTLEKLNLDGNI